VLDTVTGLADRGIRFRSHHETIDTTPGGKLIFHVTATPRPGEGLLGLPEPGEARSAQAVAVLSSPWAERWTGW
jgi:hypothetical protein